MFSGKTGPVVIDYKGDRIMDYDVWYLARGSNEFQEYMVIPMSKAGRNATACTEWLVCISSVNVVQTIVLKNNVPYINIC